MLDTLLEHGYEVAFVVERGQPGRGARPAVLGYFVRERLPFLMEVADRTAADRKGGHLAQRASDGRLVLRESRTMPGRGHGRVPGHRPPPLLQHEQPVDQLPALEQLLAEKDGVLGLPMIRNSKTLDPATRPSPKVYQLETAMGAAIACIRRRRAPLRVPRTRFAPVKTCDDLLGVRSDAFVLDRRLAHRAEPGAPLRRARHPPGPEVLQADRPDGIRVSLTGPPSLIECEELTVKGDVRFG